MEIANGPVLVLLPGTSSGEPRILGLSLTERAALAARHAGYGAIFLLARDRSAPLGVTAIAAWTEIAAALSAQAAALVIAPAGILAEPEWLMRLGTMRTAPTAWASLPNRIVVLAAAVV